MNTGMKLRINPLILVGIALMLLTGCDKDSDDSDTIKDADGNVYGTSKIGDQVWMTENLRTISFRDGTWMLTGLYDDYEWASAGAACTVYPFALIDGLNSESAVIDAYGLLYNFYAVSDSRGLCPTGWRVPTDDDWEELVTFLGGEDIAGGKLKSKRTDPDSQPRWESPNTDATDNYGFSALPSGYRTSLGYEDEIGLYATWWSSTVYNTDLAYTRYVSYSDAGMYVSYGRRRGGYAVRCIKE